MSLCFLFAPGSVPESVCIHFSRDLLAEWMAPRARTDHENRSLKEDMGQQNTDGTGSQIVDHFLGGRMGDWSKSHPEKYPATVR